MLQWFLNGEYVPAKEIREIAEDYIGTIAWHLPLQSVTQELEKHGFKVESRLGII